MLHVPIVDKKSFLADGVLFFGPPLGSLPPPGMWYCWVNGVFVSSGPVRYLHTVRGSARLSSSTRISASLNPAGLSPFWGAFLPFKPSA